MKIKHKVVKEFQFLSPDKKIFILKAGTVLEEYKHKVKTEIIPIDRDIIDNNPEFFEIIDWKAELLTYIKANKLPTPSVLTKKLVPFIEEMVLSSIQQSAVPATPSIGESEIRELERKAADLESREKRIKDKEDEIDIRLKRVEKREGEYKEDLKALDRKEDDLREKQLEVIEKGLDLDDKMQDLNEKERNLDRAALDSSKEIDEKYVKLQKKIDADLKSLSEKERELESKAKALSKREGNISSIEGGMQDKAKAYDIISDELERISPVIKSARDYIANLKRLESLEGFVSEVTRAHVTSKASQLEGCLDKIESILEKISK